MSNTSTTDAKYVAKNQAERDIKYAVHNWTDRGDYAHVLPELKSTLNMAPYKSKTAPALRAPYFKFINKLDFLANLIENSPIGWVLGVGFGLIKAFGPIALVFWFFGVFLAK